MKTLADFKRYLKVGQEWNCLHVPSKKNLGIRKVAAVQTTKFGFESHLTKGEISWCDWPKSRNIKFEQIEGRQYVYIYDIYDNHRLTYWKE